MAVTNTANTQPSSACQLRVLLGVQLHSVLSAAGLKKNHKDEKSRGLGTTILSAVVSVAVYGYIAYQLFQIATLLVAFGASEVIPALATLLGALISVFFTFAKAPGTLFGAKDYELTMSFPVTQVALVLSKSLALFGSAIMWSAAVALPLYVGYFAGVGVTVWGVLVAFLGIALAPVPLTVVAIAASILVTAIAARFKHSGAAGVLLGVLLMVGVMALSFWLGASTGYESDAADLVATQVAATKDSLASVWPPAIWLGDALAQGSVVALVGFAALSVVCFAACTALLAHFYVRLNDLVKVRSRAQAASEKDLTARTTSLFGAMVKKELACLAGTPYYAFNCLIGEALVLLGCLVFAVGGNQIFAMMAGDPELTLDVVSSDEAGIFLVFLPWLMAYFVSLATTTSVAVSMEGRAAWVMCTAPASTQQVLGSKIAAQFAHSVPVLVVGLGALMVGVGLPLPTAVECFCLALANLLMVSLIGMTVDLRKPNYGWSVPAEVLKRSAPVITSTLVAVAIWIVSMVGSGFLFAAFGEPAAHIANWAAILVELGVAAVLWRLAAKKALYV